MTEIGYMLAGLLAGIVIGWLIGTIRQKGKSDGAMLDLNRQLSRTESDVHHAQTTTEQLNKQLTESRNKLEEKQQVLDIQSRHTIELEADNRVLLEKLGTQKSELEKLHETIKLEFQNVANAIFDEKTRSFNELSSEKLTNLLNPLNN
ncbi:MAG: hypothetical protein Q8914_06325, partial [Bacteroidota bacterium]|nr:hypothetical protein [Bacteroidota bacterium]